MATVTAQMIINRAASTLLDETGVRWSPEELLQYLSDGQREAVILRPSANTENKVVQLTPGTKQTIPSNGNALIDVPRSMGADGNSPGRAVRPLDRAVIDVSRPDWHTESPNKTAKHVMYDDRDPKHFYVYPPQPDPAGYVEVVYSASPEEIESQDSPIGLSDEYQTPLYYYVVYRALAKETGSLDFNKATAYYQQFGQALSANFNAKRQLNPEQAATREQQAQNGTGYGY